MYNLKHNNYHLKPKNSNIYTPPEVSQFIFELLKDKIPWRSLILNPLELGIKQHRPRLFIWGQKKEF